jgi:hypothetical protein
MHGDSSIHFPGGNPTKKNTPERGKGSKRQRTIIALMNSSPSPPRRRQQQSRCYSSNDYIPVVHGSSKRRLVIFGIGLILANLLCVRQQEFRLQGRDAAWFISTWWVASSSPGSKLDEPVGSSSSNIPKKNEYYYDEPLEEDENVFQGVKARAFEPWLRPVPCFESSNETKAMTRGLLFLKTVKTGSTTALGVQLSIAQNNNATIIQAESTLLDNDDDDDDTMCHGVFSHQQASHAFPQPNHSASFLWTVVRDPTSRLVSYLFFHYVSRLKLEPLDHVFIDHIRNDKKSLTNHYMTRLSLKPYKTKTKDPVHHANSILNDYNFIAVTERMVCCEILYKEVSILARLRVIGHSALTWCLLCCLFYWSQDESMVALSLILGVPLSDVLYMNGAKGSGGFDDGQFHNQCTWIVPSFISPGMEEFFQSSEYQALVRYDYAIHQAANRSLDLTIDRLGVERFEQNLALYQEARRLAQDECLPTTVFPCSTGNIGSSPANSTSCLLRDAGCGYKCLNEISARLGIDRILS